MSPVISTRPELSEEEMAAVVIAIEMLVPSRATLDDNVDPTPAWRFSGRWFTGPRTRA